MGSLSKYRQHCMTTLAAFGLMGLVVTGSFTFFNQTPKQPQTELAMRVLTPVIAKGEPVVVRASGIRNKMCVVFLARSFKDLTSGYTIHKELVPGGFNSIGPWSEDIAMRLPDDMGEGDYQLRVIQNNDCGDEVYPIAFPTVTFSIISQH